MKRYLLLAAGCLLISAAFGLASCDTTENTYRTPPGMVEVPCGNWPPGRAPDDDSPCYQPEPYRTTPGGTR